MVVRVYGCKDVWLFVYGLGLGLGFGLLCLLVYGCMGV